MKNIVAVNTIPAREVMLKVNDRYKSISPERDAKTAASIIIVQRRCVRRCRDGTG